MSSTPPILRRERTRTRLAGLAGLVALAGAGTWSFGPFTEGLQLGEFVVTVPTAGTVHAATAPELDRTAFETRLWNPEPAESPTPDAGTRPQAPGKPLRVRLVGITRTGSEFTAALYDLESDELLEVHDGQLVQGHTVRGMNAKGLQLVRGNRAVELLLEGTR